MSREYKHYSMRATKKPAKNARLSTTVAIQGADGKRYYCYVSFSDKLVEKVGKVLPRGVSEFDPAYLFVSLVEGTMRVYARYVRDDSGRELWSASLKESGIPDWLSFYPVKVENGTRS